ncbi:putative RNA helicase [Helianthus debilis subsp. tardiflorus]
MLHEALVEYNYGVTPIHGNLTQDDRDKVVKELREGLTNVLISTDLLAHGFDQSKVNLVVNYGLPVYCKNYSEPDNDAYLYHICRAGRFGRKGNVFPLLSLS